jgi:hypothetical protein
VKYTLVQHSAWGVAQDPQFKNAVEEAAVTSAAVEAKILEAGGLVFPSYEAAAKAEYDENYPPGVEGIIPRVQGQFSGPLVDGRRVYVPKRNIIPRAQGLANARARSERRGGR